MRRFCPWWLLSLSLNVAVSFQSEFLILHKLIFFYGSEFPWVQFCALQKVLLEHTRHSGSWLEDSIVKLILPKVILILNRRHLIYIQSLVRSSEVPALRNEWLLLNIINFYLIFSLINICGWLHPLGSRLKIYGVSQVLVFVKISVDKLQSLLIIMKSQVFLSWKRFTEFLIDNIVHFRVSWVRPALSLLSRQKRLGWLRVIELLLLEKLLIFQSHPKLVLCGERAWESDGGLHIRCWWWFRKLDDRLKLNWGLWAFGLRRLNTWYLGLILTLLSFALCAFLIILVWSSYTRVCP